VRDLEPRGTNIPNFKNPPINLQFNDLYKSVAYILQSFPIHSYKLSFIMSLNDIYLTNLKCEYIQTKLVKYSDIAKYDTKNAYNNII